MQVKSFLFKIEKQLIHRKIYGRTENHQNHHLIG